MAIRRMQVNRYVDNDANEEITFFVSDVQKIHACMYVDREKRKVEKNIQN